MATTPSTAKSGTDEQQTDKTHSNDDTQYRCPHCSATYGDERLARVHITRADDPVHTNRNGLMPEETIEVCDSDGAVVDTITRRPDEIDLDSVSTADVLSDLPVKRQHAIVVATQHPEITSHSELADRACEQLRDADTAVESIAARTVKRALDDVFYTDTDTDTSGDMATQPADLTPMQQAVWIAKAVSPDLSNAQLAAQVGCATSYPGQIFRDNEELFGRLNARLETDTPEAIITDELDAAALETITTGGFTSDIPIDIESLIGEMDTDDPDDSAPSETDAGENTDADSTGTRDEPTHKPRWGSPTASHGVMQAAPEMAGRQPTAHADEEPPQQTLSDSAGSTGHEESDTASTGSTPSESAAGDGAAFEEIPDDDTPDQQHQPASQTTQATAASSAAPEEIESTDIERDLRVLEKQVSFFKRVVTPADQLADATVLVQSFAKQVERQCIAIRQAHDT